MLGQDVAEPSTNLGVLANLLPKGTKFGKLEKAISLYFAGKLIYDAGKKQWNKYQEHNKFVVAIPGDDDLYPLVHDWIVDQVPAADRHALVARAGSKSDNGEVGVDSSYSKKEEAPKLRLLYDSTQTQILLVNGSSIEISLIRPDWAGKIDVSKDSYLAQMAKREERIVFIAKSAYDQEKVLEFLRERAMYLSETRSPRLYICTRWGGWSRRNDLPERSLASVILKSGQKESLVDDLNEFFKHEETYGRLGVPWHRGYLLYGPPGTGKTSFARALATHFNLDTYYVPLRDLEEDSSLIQAIADVPARSVLLLEDIDTVQPKADGEDKKGISIGGLLNALDGVVTPHGLITIMTTNHIDELDDRLIREGRADIREEFTYVDWRQLVEMVKQFTKIDISRVNGFHLKSTVFPASIIHIVKSNLNDPEKAVSKIKELCGS